MAVALAIGVIGAACLFGLLPLGADGATPWLRTAAAASALTLVWTSMLPAAADALGLLALVLAVVCFLLPSLLERALHRSSLGTESALLGLMVHQAVDGAQIAWLGNAEGIGGAVAVALHGAALVAAAVVAASGHGARAALTTAGVLMGSTLLGVSLGSLATHGVLHEVEPWVRAAVSGLLLHAMMHEIGQRMPSSAAGRVADVVLALGAALGTAWLLEQGSSQHDHGSHLAELWPALGSLTLQTAPSLLLGLLAAAGWIAAEPLAARTSGSPGPHAQLPEVVSEPGHAARGLVAAGVGPAVVVGMLVAGPQLMPDTVLLTASLMGWPMALARLGAGILVGVAAALVVGSGEGSAMAALPTQVLQRGLRARFVPALDLLLRAVLPWVAAGLLAAALVQGVVGSAEVAALGGAWFEIPVVTLVAVPLYVCAPAVTPLAKALVAKGMSTAAVLTGMVLGPALSLPALGLLRGAFGLRVALTSVAAIVGAMWLLGAVLAPIPTTLGAPPVPGDGVGAGAVVATAVLVSLAVRSLLTHSFRGWLAVLGGDHAHEHGQHEHGHHEHAHS